MSCDATQLTTDALANGFLSVAFNAPLFRKLSLQMAMQASGKAFSYDELLAQAMGNGFLPIALNEALWRSLILAMVCDVGG